MSRLYRSQKSGIRSQKSEVRSQESKVKKKSEFRSRKSKVKSQKSEVRTDRILTDEQESEAKIYSLLCAYAPRCANITHYCALTRPAALTLLITVRLRAPLR